MSSGDDEFQTIYFGRQPDPADREQHTVSQEDADLFFGNREGTTIVTDLDNGERLEIEHADCGLGCKCAARIVRYLDRPPRVEIITVRDPDGGTDVHLLVDGVEIAFEEYGIDAGHGWEWEDWKEARDANLESASPGARRILENWYASPPGGKYIEGKPDGEPWLPESKGN